ncbi:MAG: Maf family protein [Polyangiaceae bacterium]|nr:Maf family protein [Polyangiaceae bacterium]
MLISDQFPLLLGSASPRRRDLLSGLGLPIRVFPRDIDESVRAGEGAMAYLERIVEAKQVAVWNEFSTEPEPPFTAILVADTVVVLDEQILGKPTDIAHAFLLLQKLAGRTHRVMTRFVLRDRNPLGPKIGHTVTTEVTLANPGETCLRRYAATGEGLDKAGAYAAQGIGAFLVERLVGSYTNVVGLPVSHVVEALVSAGWLKDFP